MTIDRMISMKKNEWELAKNLIDYNEKSREAALQKKSERVKRVNIDQYKNSDVPTKQKKGETKDDTLYNPKSIL